MAFTRIMSPLAGENVYVDIGQPVPVQVRYKFAGNHVLQVVIGIYSSEPQTLNGADITTCDVLVAASGTYDVVSQVNGNPDDTVTGVQIHVTS